MKEKREVVSERKKMDVNNQNGECWREKNVQCRLKERIKS